MVTFIVSQFKIVVRVVILFSILTGIIYPFVITGIAQLLFPWRSNGSMITHQGKPIGSLLIGQYFTQDKYFWGRPSATSRFPYDSEYSSGSNLALTNPLQIQHVKTQVDHWKASNPEQNGLIPMDLVTASASGLDPEISPAGAYYQVSRIAKARKLSETEVNNLIQRLRKKRTFLIFGEPRINVFELNLLLEHLNSKTE